MTSVFDQDVNIDGSTGVWFKDDYVVTNRSSDRITVLDVRSYLTANEAIDDSLIAGIGVSYLGLFRLRSDTGAITLRLSAVPTSFTADQDFTPEVESVLVVAVKTGDRQIAVELGSDTDNPYTNMDVVSYVGDDDWDGTQADAIDRFITYNVGREDDATVVLIKSDHVEFQAATLEFASTPFTGSEISGAVEASTGEPTASATASSETVNEVSGEVEASTIAPTASVTAQSEQVGETSGAVEASTGEPEASVTAQSEGATEVSGAVEASTVAPTASVTAQSEGVDRFPFLSRISNQFGVPGGSYSYVLPEVTSGNPPFTYSIHNIPSGFSFNSTTRTLTGTLPEDDVTITYRVEDDDGDIFDREFVISILEEELEINDPSSVVATAGEGYIDLAWDWEQGDYPNDELRALVFEIQYKHKKEIIWIEDSTVEFGRRIHTIEGLALSQPYNWRIRAVGFLNGGSIGSWVVGETSSTGDPIVIENLIFEEDQHNVWLENSDFGSYNTRLWPLPIEWEIDGNTELLRPSGFSSHHYSFLKTLKDIYFYFNEEEDEEGILQMFLSVNSVMGGFLRYSTEAPSPSQENGVVVSLWSGQSNVQWSGGRSWSARPTNPFLVPKNHFLYFWLDQSRNSDDFFSLTSPETKFENSISFSLVDRITNVSEQDIIEEYQLLSQLDEEDGSNNRPGSFAKYFTFTLTSTRTITVDMESSGFDSYLYLLEGNDGGTILEENDDIDADNNDYNSQIIRELNAGTYTVEATSHGVDSLGDFILQVS